MGSPASWMARMLSLMGKLATDWLHLAWEVWGTGKMEDRRIILGTEIGEEGGTSRP